MYQKSTPAYRTFALRMAISPFPSFHVNYEAMPILFIKDIIAHSYPAISDTASQENENHHYKNQIRHVMRKSFSPPISPALHGTAV